MFCNRQFVRTLRKALRAILRGVTALADGLVVEKDTGQCFLSSCRLVYGVGWVGLPDRFLEVVDCRGNIKFLGQCFEEFGWVGRRFGFVLLASSGRK